MGKGPIGSANVGICEKSGIPLARECGPRECESCGWNPEVNAKRRKKIHWYARHKILRMWGKSEDWEAEGRIGS